MNNKTLGGIKSAQTIKERYGENYLAEIGRKGGQAHRKGGVSGDTERAKELGRLGGLKRAENYRLKKLAEAKGEANGNS